MHSHRDVNQSGAEKDNWLLFGERWYCFPNPRWRRVFSQSGVELGIQDGGAHDSVESGWPVFQHGRAFVGAAILNF